MRSVLFSAIALMIAGTAHAADLDQIDITVHKVETEDDGTRIVFTVQNNDSRTIETLIVSCSLYGGSGQPVGAENGYTKGVYEAKCRPTGVIFE